MTVQWVGFRSVLLFPLCISALDTEESTPLTSNMIKIGGCLIYLRPKSCDQLIFLALLPKTFPSLEVMPKTCLTEYIYKKSVL